MGAEFSQPEASSQSQQPPPYEEARRRGLQPVPVQREAISYNRIESGNFHGRETFNRRNNRKYDSDESYTFLKMGFYESLTDFKLGALLIQVNWIEVTGKLPLLLFRNASAVRHEICYVVNFRVDSFEWHSAPIKFKVRINREETENSMILESYQEKHGTWHKIPGSEFSVNVDSDEGSMKFGMYEVESSWWKGIMVLAGVKIRPLQVIH